MILGLKSKLSMCSTTLVKKPKPRNEFNYEEIGLEYHGHDMGENGFVFRYERERYT